MQTCPRFPLLLLGYNGPTWGSVLVPTVGIVMAAAALVHQQSTPSTAKKSISTPIGHVVVGWVGFHSAQLRDYITLPRPRIWWLTKSFRSQFCRCSKHHQPQVMRQHQPGTKSHKTNLFWFNSCWNRFRAGLVWYGLPLVVIGSVGRSVLPWERVGNRCVILLSHQQSSDKNPFENNNWIGSTILPLLLFVCTRWWEKIFTITAKVFSRNHLATRHMFWMIDLLAGEYLTGGAHKCIWLYMPLLLVRCLVVYSKIDSVVTRRTTDERIPNIFVN